MARILVTCRDCKKDRLVETNGMLKASYEKRNPRCHKCGFNKEICSKTWFTSEQMKGNKYREGLEPWNKNTKGLTKANKTSFTSRSTRGDKNPRWKGDEVGYYALHAWLRREYGEASKCEHCGDTENVEWASKDYSYTRGRGAWIHLCFPCHRKYDSKNGWGIATYKFGLGK